MLTPKMVKFIDEIIDIEEMAKPKLGTLGEAAAMPLLCGMRLAFSFIGVFTPTIVSFVALGLDLLTYPSIHTIKKVNTLYRDNYRFDVYRDTAFGQFYNVQIFRGNAIGDNISVFFILDDYIKTGRYSIIRPVTQL